MKKIRNRVFSVLLFAFTFFVVHDHVIMSVDVDTQHEICFSKNDKSNLDLASQIHDCIHVLLAVSLQENSLFALTISSVQPSYTQVDLTSHVRSIPQRPPLS